MKFNQDLNRFLIAGKRIQSNELANDINSVKHDTNAILALIKQRGKASVMQRARVSHPAWRTKSGVGASERNSTGRFVKKMKAAADVAKAVRSMTRQPAMQVATQARTALINYNRNLPSASAAD